MMIKSYQRHQLMKGYYEFQDNKHEHSEMGMRDHIKDEIACDIFDIVTSLNLSDEEVSKNVGH